MVTEENQLAGANEGFYRAFESLDLGEMEKIWAKESYIQCIHPIHHHSSTVAELPAFSDSGTLH